MMEINRSALVLHSDVEMFDLVADVSNYFKFLPWCSNSRILMESQDLIMASLGVDYHGVKQEITTENSLLSPKIIKMDLVDGPFKKLKGRWEFLELDKRSCRVKFSLDFKFNNFVLHKVATPVFIQVADVMLDSFMKRADEVYGA